MRDSFLRRRVVRKLESLPDDRLYQVLDYVEFLEEKYGEGAPTPDGMQKFAERVQDRLRGGRARPWALKGVMGALSVVDRAVGVAARAARGLAEEFSDAREGGGESQPKPMERSTKIVID